jgi:cytoskeletal protein CcmA (bactofilin family)
MLNRTKSENPAIAANVNLIGGGTQINGDVVAHGDIRVDGVLNGNLTGATRVVVGPEGRVNGNIHCTFAEIIGQVKGDVVLNETLTLRANARIDGNITIGRLIVESGAVFTGNCTMQNPPQGS